MTTAAILIARIRSRERVMENIARRNPDSHHSNPYYVALKASVRSYRDALVQLERSGVVGQELTRSR
jgi:hypothetical protein